MQRKLIAALLGWIVLAMTPGARAETAFDVFTNVCIANQAQTAPVIAAMTGGWTPLPANMLKALSQKMTMEDAYGWMRFADKTVQIVLQARGHMPVMPNAMLRLCVIMSMGQTGNEGPEHLLEAANAYADVPSQDNKGMTYWMWREDNGRHEPTTLVPENDEAKAAVLGGTLRVLFGQEDMHKAFVALAIPEVTLP